MKPVLLLALALVLLAQTGCEKAADPEAANPESVQAPDEGSIIGAWELRLSYGGFNLPNTSPVYEPGNGRIWRFTDSSYTLYEQNRILISGLYHRTKDISPATGTLMDAIVMPQNGNIKIHYGFSKDTLVLFQGTIAADGTIQKYVRVPPPAGVNK